MTFAQANVLGICRTGPIREHSLTTRVAAELACVRVERSFLWIKC
jgi:hypothetical protein